MTDEGTSPAQTSLFSQLTPEQAKEVELNRLKAKERQRLKEHRTWSTSTQPNVNNKRTAGASTASGSNQLKRDSRLGTYFEYDLSKMVNSKGGFLLEDGNEVDETVRRKEKEREAQRALQNLDPRAPLGVCTTSIQLNNSYSHTPRSHTQSEM